MRIFPSKLQWSKWTLPTKVSYLAFWMTILALIVGVLVPAFLGKSANQIKNSNVAGDVVGRDKIVYQPIINLPDTESVEDFSKKIQGSKIRINRFIDDFSLEVENIEREYLKENKKIASNFSSRGTLSSGMHISTQMEYARNTKDRIEKLFTSLNRNIEDILFENFGITKLEENDNFRNESSRLLKAKEKVRNTYDGFESTVKRWEKTCIGNNQLTQNFRL